VKCLISIIQTHNRLKVKQKTAYIDSLKVFVVHHLVDVLVFKLFVFTVVKTKKSSFEQNNAWYAVVPICLDTV